jgi:hypothetical protein
VANLDLCTGITDAGMSSVSTVASPFATGRPSGPRFLWIKAAWRQVGEPAPETPTLIPASLPPTPAAAHGPACAEIITNSYPDLRASRRIVALIQGMMRSFRFGALRRHRQLTFEWSAASWRSESMAVLKAETELHVSITDVLHMTRLGRVPGAGNGCGAAATLGDFPHHARTRCRILLAA